MLDITKCLKDAISKLEMSVSGDKALLSTIHNIERELDRAGAKADEAAVLLGSVRSRIKGRTVAALAQQSRAEVLES